MTRTTDRILWCSALVCLLSVLAVGQQPPAEEIVANQNRVSAGKLESGVLKVQLEIRAGVWHPEADDGPKLFVQAFGEARRTAQIPGPMLRMPEGTTIQATVTNKLKVKATLYGLNTRPCDATAGLEIPAGENRQFDFVAGAPGTYYYWARTTEPLQARGRTFVQPLRADAQLNGAFIVDPAGPVVPDRVFVINTMFVAPDIVHPGFEVLTINGKSYPYTEPLTYPEGETIRWRVLNPGISEHPMHLHGAFYALLSGGGFERDVPYAASERRSVVTQSLRGGSTMMMEWTPEHPGRWLFHCHLAAHISTEERVPVFHRGGEDHAAPAHPTSEAMRMEDMAGLVLMINVQPKAGSSTRASASAARKLDLLIERNPSAGAARAFSCSVREGNELRMSGTGSVGPPIVLTRGQPVEITVVNRLDVPTIIHWHGLELESYYDGVLGGGLGDQVTPAVAPGGSFVARFTPNRAGTFIYHTHASDPSQLPGGIYGGLIVLAPGQSFDAEHDRLLVIGARDDDFYTTRMTVNGAEELKPMVLRRGARYRLRIVNIAPNLRADLRLGSAEHPAAWRALAKDGADLPGALAKLQNAALHIASGEVYDFEFQPGEAGEIPLLIENELNDKGKLSGKILVQ